MTFLASHQVRRNRWGQWGFVNTFLTGQNQNQGGRKRPTQRLVPTQFEKVPPGLATCMSLLGLLGQLQPQWRPARRGLRVLTASQPAPLSLPSPECGCRIAQANCSRSLCQLNYMHFRVAVWLWYWPFLIQILTKFVPDLALFKVDSRRNHARLLALPSGCVSPVPDRQMIANS